MKQSLLRACGAMALAFCAGQALAQSPGGVGTGLKLWLKGNNGVTTGSGTVSAWADQSGNATNATQATVSRQPSYTASSPLFNGYPVLNFDRVDDGMTTSSSIGALGYSFFVVFNSTDASVGPRRAVQGSVNWLIGPYNNLPSLFTGTAFNPAGPAFNGAVPTVNSVTVASSATPLHYVNGKVTGASATGAGAPGTIGLGNAGAYNEPMGGSIAEVIAYTSTLSATDRSKVESYLALKYGLTLDQSTATSYVNSAGTTIFNAGTQAGFTSDVTGIIVDNGSNLSQSSARSSNPTAVLGISNPSTALANGEYLIAGDNAFAIDARSADVPSGYGQRLKRVWRVSKSAAASTVTLKIFIGDIPELVLQGRSLSNVAILTSSSTSFAAATAYAASGTTGTANDTLVIPNVALNNNDYFTLSLGANTVPTTGDFEFWYGVPEWSPQFPTPQKLHFTGASLTDYAYYVIDEPANPSFTPISGLIAPGAARIIDLSNYIAYGSTAAPAGVSIVTRPANAVVNAGLRITVKGQMGAYYTNENQVNYASFPLRGPNALGTSFYIPGQTLYDNGPSYTAPATSEIIVTATQDNTIVTITPSEAIVGHGANVPFSVTLNKGQSYQAQNVARTGKHLAGSLVKSTNPVAVTYSDDLLSILTAPGGADNAGDQLVPVARYGNDYVHVRTTLNGFEPLYIIGSQPNTTVTIFDGTTTTTQVVGAGEMSSVISLASGKNVQYVHSDKPVLAYQIGGSGSEAGSGILTPASGCKGTRVLAYQYPLTAIQANFNFVVPAGIEGNFLINGSSSIITAGDFSTIPGLSGWKYSRKAVTSYFSPGQTITIQNTAGKFFFYQNMQTSGGGDFSNFSDFGNVVLFPKASYPCSGNTVTLSSGAIAYNASIAGYAWSGPNGYTSAAANPTRTSMTAADSGWYRLTVTDNNGCDYTDSILVDRPITAVSVASSPSAACVGSTVNFTSSQTGGAADSVRWTGPSSFTSTQKNFALTNVTTAQAGTYTATYYDRYGCPVSGGSSITVSASTISPLTVSGIDKLSCGAPATTLGVAAYAQGIGYQLYSPFNASSIFATSNFTAIAPGFYNQIPAARGTTAQMNLGGLTGISAGSAAYAVQYDGYLYLAGAGSYTFYTSSKDGSNLYIDGSQVVANDGGHTLTEVASNALNLSAGYHKINASYFVNPAGSAALTVSYSATSPVIAKTAIPASILYYASGSAPGGGSYTGYTYSWSSPTNNGFSASGTTAAVTSPGTYNLTAAEPGGCTSITPYAVSAIASYDYGDLPSTWPSAQAVVINCPNGGGVPAGAAAAVWAGSGVSYETNIYSNALTASAGADSYDDGLQAPSTTLGLGDHTYSVTMNSNQSGKTVYYGLWFDWNNNGNFADDTARTGGHAFYSGSGVTASPVTVPVVVGVPNGISSQYKARLVVSDAPVGFADFANTFSNGEVEDYQAPPIALPLRFGTFTATVHNCAVAVSFETYSEHGGGRYIIERSSDGRSWHAATSLEGKGGIQGTSGANSYSYVDAAPYKGKSYYRVREVNPNNTYTLSPVMPVSLSCDGSAGTVLVHPNPASGSFEVRLGGSYSGDVRSLELYNSLGQRMPVTIGGSGDARTVSTGSLPNGVYQLRLSGGSGWTASRTVMILNN